MSSLLYLTCIILYDASHLVAETSQEISDVPYGDYFRVEVQCSSSHWKPWILYSLVQNAVVALLFHVSKFWFLFVSGYCLHSFFFCAEEAGWVGGWLWCLNLWPSSGPLVHCWCIEWLTLDLLHVIIWSSTSVAHGGKNESENNQWWCEHLVIFFDSLTVIFKPLTEHLQLLSCESVKIWVIWSSIFVSQST